ncbi:hypothetical protein ACJX0J_030767, partial [Zea mays]
HNLNRSVSSTTYARTTCTTPRGEDGWKSHGHQHDEAVVVEEGKKKNKSLLRARNPHRVGDKVLAEFITELGRDSTTVLEFDAKLMEKGDDFPDYFVHALLTILQPIASNPSSATVAEGPAGAESAKFPGLARPDDPDHARNLRLELERDAYADPPAPMRDDRDRRWDGRGRDRDYLPLVGRDPGDGSHTRFGLLQQRCEDEVLEDEQETKSKLAGTDAMKIQNFYYQYCRKYLHK